MESQPTQERWEQAIGAASSLDLQQQIVLRDQELSCLKQTLLQLQKELDNLRRSTYDKQAPHSNFLRKAHSMYHLYPDLLHASARKEREEGEEKKEGGEAESIRSKPLNKIVRQLSTWELVQSQPEPTDIVMVPSASLEESELAKMQGINYYEERCLFMLLRLKNPNTRVCYLTSLPVHKSSIKYYLSFLEELGITRKDAKRRLLMLSVHDTTCTPLSSKLLQRPHTISRIKRWLQERNASNRFMTCFMSTALEQNLAELLQLPLHANTPKLNCLGTKHGSRKVFSEAGVPHPDGFEEVFSKEELISALIELCNRNPQARRICIKLNHGVSGEGNAILWITDEVRCLLDSSAPEAKKMLGHALENDLQFVATSEHWPAFHEKIKRMGAIGEIWFEQSISSPSFQGIISPTGIVQALSTHEQVLEGQIFQGCEFPAEQHYRHLLHKYGILCGEVLARQGAQDRYGVDFLTFYDKEQDQWSVTAIEINLRWGGTTHPYEMVKLVTNATYQEDSGTLVAPNGEEKYYRGTDNLKSVAYQGLTPLDLNDIIADNSSLRWNKERNVGVIFHLIGALSEYGKVGMVAVGNSREEARCAFNDAVETLNEATSQ